MINDWEYSVDNVNRKYGLQDFLLKTFACINNQMLFCPTFFLKAGQKRKHNRLTRGRKRNCHTFAFSGKGMAELRIGKNNNFI